METILMVQKRTFCTIYAGLFKIHYNNITASCCAMVLNLNVVLSSLNKQPMLSLSGEDSVLFMFFLTEVHILSFFPLVDMEKDQKHTEFLSRYDWQENHPIKTNE